MPSVPYLSRRKKLFVMEKVQNGGGSFRRYVDILSDSGFKAVFGDENNTDVIIDFLNVVLPEERRVRSLTFSVFPMIHSLIATFLFRIPLSWLCSRLDPDGLHLMGYAPPFSTMVSLTICIFYIRYWRRRKRPAPGQDDAVEAVAATTAQN